MKERIGLRRDASGYSLFEVFGTLERNMLPNEKVADAMFKWEKYARTTNSPKTLKLTFKVCISYVCTYVGCRLSTQNICMQFTFQRP